MNEHDPKIIDSKYSRFVTEDEITVQLCIYRLDIENEWSLELVTKDNAQIVWEEVFDSDEAAHDEFKKALAEEGMKALAGDEPDLQMPQNQSV